MLYLVGALSVYIYGLWWVFSTLFLQEPYKLWITCALIGGIGGTVYCMRGVYLNACVSKDWDKSWIPWYILRPLVSFVFGAMSYIFLKAGLLILDSKVGEDTKFWGFYMLAFIAGYNVDNFAKKVEDVSAFLFGIKKSRSAEFNGGKESK